MEQAQPGGAPANAMLATEAFSSADAAEEANGLTTPVPPAKRKARSGPRSRTSPYIGVSQVGEAAGGLDFCADEPFPQPNSAMSTALCPECSTSAPDGGKPISGMQAMEPTARGGSCTSAPSSQPSRLQGRLFTWKEASGCGVGVVHVKVAHV